MLCIRRDGRHCGTVLCPESEHRQRSYILSASGVIHRGSAARDASPWGDRSPCDALRIQLGLQDHARLSSRTQYSLVKQHRGMVLRSISPTKYGRMFGSQFVDNAHKIRRRRIIHLQEHDHWKDRATEGRGVLMTRRIVPHRRQSHGRYPASAAALNHLSRCFVSVITPCIGNAWCPHFSREE